MTRITLHIDRLVLTGFDHQTREAFAKGFREQLTLEFASHTLARQLPSHQGTSVLRVGTVRTEHGAPPAAMGAQVAQNIVRKVGS